mgnify:CR=1 FL=1
MEAQEQRPSKSPPTVQGECVSPILCDMALIASNQDSDASSKLVLRARVVQSGDDVDVDAVAVNAANFRIVAKLAQRPLTAQKQAAEDRAVELDLGRPPSGNYVVELHVRRDGGLHKLQQAFVVTIQNSRRLAANPLGVGQDAD